MEKHIGDLMRIVRCTNYFRTQKMADSGFKMTEDSIVNVIKEAANFKPDEASKEIIEAKNAEIRELKKYKTLWESRNTSK